jgi:SagB-type dehydrogenase family enzyme
MSKNYLIAVFAFMFLAVTSWGQIFEEIKLLKPQVKGGMPLMEALNARKSSRVFSSKELPPQMLSNLLWAAFGVNRPIEGKKIGKRTAPTACNWQEIDIYVAMAKGTYLYDAKNHVLKPVVAKDLRAVVGKQGFTKDAPVGLIFVADYKRMGMVDDKVKNFYASTDTGFISQNVYLFCASENLATVVLGMVARSALSKALNLNSDQKIILTQPVGFHKEAEKK